VYFVSDHTGVTAEVIGHSLLARFDEESIETRTRPFVDSLERADALVAELIQLPEPPIIFSTITDAAIRQRIGTSGGIHLDLFEPFIHSLENALGRTAATRVGAAHSIRNLPRYQARIDAVEFSLATDDGSNVGRYGRAEIVMVGVSRVGKSPTCLYLAMQYGVRASNYPLADDDFERPGLPQKLNEHRSKLFGLTINPARLHELRQRRRPGSGYAAPERCEYEVAQAERLYRRHGVPFLDVTNVSVEELASLVLQRANLARHR
jgi:regulator of PEP synthase PpsR (kinase-PPPase family)